MSTPREATRRRRRRRSPRPQYAQIRREFLSRREHDSLLAQPNWRRLRKYKISTTPLTLEILTFATTDRLISLAKPRPNHAAKYIVKERPKDPKTGVSIAALKANNSPRNNQLAFPPRRCLEAMLRGVKGKKNRLLKNVDALLKTVRSTPGIPSIHNCLQRRASPTAKFPRKKKGKPPVKQAGKQPSKLVLKGKEKPDKKTVDAYWQHLATPRKVIDPASLLPERVKVPLSKLRKRIEDLSTPVEKDLLANFQRPWKLTQSMTDFKASDRLKTISKHKERPMPPPLDPTKVSEAAIKYKPTKRIEELATPKAKQMAKETGKENAFSVKPEALKARCSKRTKELAQPVKKDEDKDVFVNPFEVKKSAIKLKNLSPRINDLAVPRGPIPEIKRAEK